MSIREELESLAESFIADHLNHGANDHELGCVDSVAEEVAVDMADEMESDLESMITDWMERHGTTYCDSADAELERKHDDAVEDLKTEFMDQMQTIDDDGSTGWDIAIEMLQIRDVGETLSRDMAQEYSGMAYKAAKNWFSGMEWAVLDRDGLIDEWYGEWADEQDWDSVVCAMDEDDVATVNPLTDM